MNRNQRVAISIIPGKSKANIICRQPCHDENVESKQLLVLHASGNCWWEKIQHTLCWFQQTFHILGLLLGWLSLIFYGSMFAAAASSSIYYFIYTSFMDQEKINAYDKKIGNGKLQIISWPIFEIIFIFLIFSCYDHCRGLLSLFPHFGLEFMVMYLCRCECKLKRSFFYSKIKILNIPFNSSAATKNWHRSCII